MTIDADEVFNSGILRIFKLVSELFDSYDRIGLTLIMSARVSLISWGVLILLAGWLTITVANWFCRYLRCPCAQCQSLDLALRPRGAICWFCVWFGTAALALFWIDMGVGERLVWLAWLAVLGLAAMVDARTSLLPNELNLLVLLSGLVWRSLDPSSGDFQLPEPAYLWGVLLGWGIPYGFNAWHERWRGFSAIGQGDAKLLAGLGAWLGMQALPLIWVVASVSVLVYTGSWWMFTRRWQSQVKFGPFLVMGASTAMLISHV